jgi:HEPN domain-containing protein
MNELHPDQKALIKRWWQYATEDLQAAEALLQNPVFVARHVCTFAQQSAEKALKTALIVEQIDFPKSHDLDILSSLLPDTWTVITAFPQLRELTNWAVEARYPVHGDDPTADEARSAAQLAQGIWQAVYQDLLKRLGEL